MGQCAERSESRGGGREQRRIARRRAHISSLDSSDSPVGSLEISDDEVELSKLGYNLDICESKQREGKAS